MRARFGRTLAWVGSLLLAAGTAAARPPAERPELAPIETDVDIVGDVDGTHPAPQKVLQDTIWIADWTFDGGAPCNNAGWLHADNHILRDATQYWYITGAYNGVRSIVGNSAAVGYVNNVCCEDLNGYDNDWYYGIRIPYAGAATIHLDFLVDSETGFDFLSVESDSACASFDRVNYVTAPQNNAQFYRKNNIQFSGLNNTTGTAHIDQALTNYGSGTSCCWISFIADGGFSPCDGENATSIGAGAVVDNISITDANGTRSEDFTDGVLSNGWTFVNMADNKPFGIWARLFEHITDNDVCTENRTCAWLWTDDTTPTLANDPSMAFGPGGFVVKNWLDDTVIGPWVSLASTPTAKGTILKFRRFSGNFFTTGKIVQNWAVRAKLACGSGLSGWGHASQWNSLSLFQWLDFQFSMTPNFDPSATDLQLRFRTSDWQYITGAGPPTPFIPGPGPFGGDRIRIGRLVLSGPVINEGIDSRSQGQDAFPTELHPGIPLGTGEHYRPTTDRFGTCAFSQGSDLTINKTSSRLVTGDSVNVSVLDSRGTGGITAVQWYGAIVSGPHAGKAPAPYTVGGNGFFVTNADSSRTAGGLPIANRYFRDLDDTYFRGGDVLNYFWAATDAQGGFSSDPVGLTGAPANIAAAQAATGGMLETSFLPAINWAPTYLARIAADPNGDLTPTAAELAASTQRNCILYAQEFNSRRRSGDVNRTTFMYTLDNLGYRGNYDVYDIQGFGNTNNQLGGRATIQQALGYNLIIFDVGNATPSGSLMPDGGDWDAAKIDQATWFRNWLAQAAFPGVEFATLWLVGTNLIEERPSNALYTSNCGVTLAATNQGLNVNPDCIGQGSFTFDKGAGSSAVSYTTGARAEFTLNGGCPVIRSYDALNASAGTAARVYRYRSPSFGGSGGTLGSGAMVMNTNTAEDWNTIVMSFPLFDIRDLFDSTPLGTIPLSPPAARDLVNATLAGVLPAVCVQAVNPTDVPGHPTVDVPFRTALHQNHPNPFNPMTTIRFDLARSGRVQLRIYDVAGRNVRTLLDAEMPAGWNRSATWNGLDDAGRQVPTGVYFYRLDAAGVTVTKKMVMMR